MTLSLYSLYSESAVFTVNFCHLQVLAMYMKDLVKRSQPWIKVFFCIDDFPLTYNIICF